MSQFKAGWRERCSMRSFGDPCTIYSVSLLFPKTLETPLDHLSTSGTRARERRIPQTVPWSRPRCSAVTSATFSDPSSSVCPHIPAGDSGNESLAGFPGGKGSIAFHMPLPQMPVFAKCSNGSFCTGARDRTVQSPTFFHYKYK